tara:strand:- start:883 stop:2667 length:1785 start_codon:yes stop_codon:yes gene_type:complete
MAERSVRTRRANMQLYTPQEVAAPAQAIARGMGQLSNSMDRMSKFFAEKASMEAEIEGQQYGARNAPTAEQLQDAFQSGEELELPGGFGTVFDRAARKAALDITQTEIEFEARKRINEIITTATINGTNPSTMLDDIDAVTHGFAATFDDNSPGIARKLRAGLSIFANSKMASYENSYIADQKAKSKSQFVSTLLGTLEGLSKIIEFGIETKETDPATGLKIYRPLTPSDFVNLKLGEIENGRRKGFAPSQLTTIGNMFDAGIVESANRVLIDNVLMGESPRLDIMSIGKGQVNNLDIAAQNAVATLRGQNLSFNDIAKELQDRRIDEIRYLEQENADMDARTEVVEADLTAEAIGFMIANDPENARFSIDKISLTDREKAMELTIKLLEAGGAPLVSNPDSIDYLEGLHSNISYPDYIEHYKDLSLKDRKTYYNKAETYQDDDVKTALKIMQGQLSLPANIEAISDADPNFAKVQIFRQLSGLLAAEAASAKSLNVDIDPTEVAMRLLKGVGENIVEAEKQMKITSGNQIISNLRDKGGYELDDLQFGEAIVIVKRLRAAKAARNDRAIPEGLLGVTVLYYDIYLQSLKRAME